MRRILPHLAAVLFAGSPALAQELPPQPGVDVQARGPVHEAFARPADPAAKLVVTQPPPAPVPELPPEQRPEGDNVQWVPGYWSWDDEASRHVWVSGCWRVPPPGREWVAGNWTQTDGGWQWQPGFWAAPGGVQEFNAVPPPSLESGPSTPPPAADSYYTPGQWVFRDGAWLWQPGTWVENQAGMVYVPPCYLPTPTGSLCVPGYWDHPLEARGLLFAPVCFSGSPWVGNPGWCYRPSYAVGFGGLFGSLFARPNHGCYYFGNYFAAPYRGRGYVPWSDCGRRGYDPLLNYYGWSNRANPGWSRGLSGLYTGRLNGSLPAPAPAFSRHAAGGVPPAGFDPALVNRNTVRFGRNMSVSPVNSLATVAPLGRGDVGQVRLTNVTRPESVVRANAQTRQSFVAAPRQGSPAPRVAPPAAPSIRNAPPTAGGVVKANPQPTPRQSPPVVQIRPPMGQPAPRVAQTPPTPPVRSAAPSVGPQTTPRPSPAVGQVRPPAVPSPGVRPALPSAAPITRPVPQGPGNIAGPVPKSAPRPSPPAGQVRVPAAPPQLVPRPTAPAVRPSPPAAQPPVTPRAPQIRQGSAPAGGRVSAAPPAPVTRPQSAPSGPARPVVRSAPPQVQRSAPPAARPAGPPPAARPAQAPRAPVVRQAPASKPAPQGAGKRR